MYNARLTAEYAARAKAGDARAFDALCREFAALLNGNAMRYQIPGTEHSDRMQIARLALWEAVCIYRPGISEFPACVSSVVARRCLDAYRKATRTARGPLDNCAPLCEVAFARHKTSTTPESIALAEYDTWLSGSFLDGMGLHQKRVMVAFLRGAESWQDVQERLGCDKKSVDNALCKIRRKHRAYVQEGAQA